MRLGGRHGIRCGTYCSAGDDDDTSQDGVNFPFGGAGFDRGRNGLVYVGIEGWW